MKAKRCVLWLSVTGITFMTLCLLFIGWLTTTQSGLQWLSHHLINRIPELSVHKIQGRITSAISLSNITYQNDQTEISINRIDITWEPKKLLSKTFTIKTLSISGININQISTSSAQTRQDKTFATPSSLDAIIDRLKLPLAIDIKQLTITESQLYQNKQHNPQPTFRLNRLSLSGYLKKDALSISDLIFDSDKAGVQGFVSVALSDKRTVDGHFKWSVHTGNITPAKIAPIKSNTTLKGSLDRLEITSDFAAPYSASINTTFNVNDSDITRSLKEKINASTKITLKAIELNNIHPNWPAQTLKGKGDIAWENGIITVIGNVLEHSALTQEKAASKKATQVQFNGSAQTNTTKPNVTLNAHWQNMHWPTANDKKTLLSSPKGSIKFSGSFEQYQFSANAQLTSTQLTRPKSNNPQNTIDQEGHLHLSGTGSQSMLELSTLSLTGLLGQLEGSGRVTLKPKLATTLELSGKNINTGILFPQWPSNISLDIDINTKQDTATPTIFAKINGEGQLRHHPISLNTKAQYRSNTLFLETLKLVSTSSAITAKGSVDAQQNMQLNWAVDSQDLEELIPNTNGALTTTGEFQGKLTPESVIHSLIKAELSASSIEISNIHNDIHLDKLSLNTNIDWRNEAHPHPGVIQLSADKFSMGTIKAESININSQGLANNHQIQASAAINNHQLDTSISGNFSDNIINSTINDTTHWALIINSANVISEKLGKWSLQQPTKAVIARDQKVIEHHCWGQSQAMVCFESEQKKHQLESKLSIHQLSTSSLSPLLPDGLLWADSIINGKGHIILPTSKALQADIELTSSAGHLIWQIPAEKQNTPPTIPLQEGYFSLVTNEDQLTTSFTLPIQQQSSISGSLSINNNYSSSISNNPSKNLSPQKNNLPFKERELIGKLELSLDDLTPFSFMIPDTSDIKGKLKGQWNIGGSINNPWLDGELTLTDGQLRLNSPGVLLEAIKLNLVGNKEEGLGYTLSAQSGKGHLNLDGTLHLKSKEPHITLTLTGENAQIFATEEADIKVSPNLTVTANQENINITGDIAIPDASISPTEFSSSVVTASEDQIIIDENPPHPQSMSKRAITANINILLGDNVNIDGFGFTGRTTGNIQLTKRANETTLGKGEIRILDGEYRAFGQGLVIEKGSILFTGGPINKPGVDIKAQRQPAEGITVGALIRGNITQPDVTIFSEPVMGNSEQLSWLLLGRPLNESSEGENNAINELLLSLSLSQGNSLLNRFQNSLNLDTLAIKTGSDQAGSASDNELAELVLGKYLSPDLYVSYGIGLFNPVNILSLEYSLGRHWKLTSETSDESSGGDIVYTIEK